MAFHCRLRASLCKRFCRPSDERLSDSHSLLKTLGPTVLSAIYHDVLKDRLYTLSPLDPLRRSSQTTLDLIFGALVRLLAPVVPFTADEAWSHLRVGEDFCKDSVSLQDWPEVDSSWRRSSEGEDASRILEFKSTVVNDALEKLREEKVIGQSLDAEVEVSGHPENEIFDVLLRNEDYLPEFFITSSVVLTKVSTDESEPTVEVRHASGVRCPRSWRWVSELVQVEPWGDLSPRCAKALHSRTDVVPS